jgi:hypothetical protein
MINGDIVLYQIVMKGGEPMLYLPSEQDKVMLNMDVSG